MAYRPGAEGYLTRDAAGKILAETILLKLREKRQEIKII